MKKTLFLCFLISSPTIARDITINVPDEDIRIMENDVVDAEEWILTMIANKIVNCRERLIKKEVELSLSNQEQIPDNPESIVQKHLSRPDYKNRSERDEEERRLAREGRDE